jgi:hypothetical protein
MVTLSACTAGTVFWSDGHILRRLPDGWSATVTFRGQQNQGDHTAKVSFDAPGWGNLATFSFDPVQTNDPSNTDDYLAEGDYIALFSLQGPTYHYQDYGSVRFHHSFSYSNCQDTYTKQSTSCGLYKLILVNGLYDWECPAAVYDTDPTSPPHTTLPVCAKDPPVIAEPY